MSMGHRLTLPAFSCRRTNHRSGVFFTLLACLLALPTVAARAQTAAPLVTHAVDAATVQTLAQHHPLWASSANASTAVSDAQSFERMVVVLARPEAQEKSFEAFIASQQNPASSNYHHWLTPEEIGERFGPAASDIDAVTGWLEAQGLHINDISPNRTMIRFGGTASTIGRAFGTQLRSYTVQGQARVSVASDPTIPAALGASIRSVRGLYQIEERPQHVAQTLSSDSPEMTNGSSHYLAPADFNTIYDVPTSTYTGTGITIGIISWARVSTTDLDNFRSKTGTSFANPTVVIPTAYGGIDPGVACTSSTCSLDSDTQSGQGEATLDVIRAGGTAPGATLLLVASSHSATNDGIGEDTEYLVETSPVPAQIISISFGDCETDNGSSGVSYWNTLFQSAAAEGISVFVSSGDSAAAGCDTAFSTPPTTALANSPNAICSSQYATCVGGTQLIDTTNSSSYWSSSNNSSTLQSAISYIPEGAWNESSTSSVAGSGGGVSTVIATPSWQTDTGVPSARTGRYTPDVAFSSSSHDGYFACLALSSATCSGSSYTFTAFSGTSAAAPSMAGVAALLDQKLGGAQGNLNPALYALASSTNASSIFHDATVSSSGVSSCSLSTPSLCNTSIYSSSAGAVQQGFAVQTGYDEATGLGSLYVATFLTYFGSIATTPTISVTPASTSITTAQTLSVAIAVSGSGATPTGSMVLSSGSYSSAATTLSSGAATLVIPAGSLSVGTDTLTATYTPDSSSSSSFNTSTATATVNVTSAAATTPTVNVTTTSNITIAQSLAVTIAVSGSGTTPTGTVKLASGSYSSSTTALASGTANITVPAWTLSVGTHTLTATYTPDTAGAANYNVATGTASVIVTTAAPTVTVTPASTSILTTQSLSVSIAVSGSGSTPAGTIALSGGGYSSSATALSSGAATLAIPAGSLNVGTDTLTATYTPGSSSSYSSATGTASVTVTSGSVTTPDITLTSSPTTLTVTKGAGNTATLTITPSGGFTGTVALAASITTSPTGAQSLPTLSLSTSSVSITDTSAKQATLTLSTTAASSAALHTPARPGQPWSGGLALAGLLLFLLPSRRRAWRVLLGTMLLCAGLSLGLTACGSGTSSSSSGSSSGTSGTTAGAYTITLTATSGSTSATSTINLTVQ